MAQVSYQVTSVAPDIQFGPTGQQIPGKSLTIETSSGYRGTVFVPSSVLSDPVAVRGIIEGEVSKVYAAQQLSGTVDTG